MAPLVLALTGVFGSTFTITLLLHRLLFGESIRMSERLTEVVGTAPVSIRQQELSFPLFHRFIKPVVAGLAKVLVRHMPAVGAETLEKRLTEAGRPWNLSGRELLAIKYVLAGLNALALMELWKLAGQAALQSAVMALVGGIAGWLLPDAVLSSKARQRREQVEKSLPDVLDLITVCVEAGLGFDAALVKVVEKSKGVLADELFQVLQEIRMGKPRREALREMADRMAVEDLSNFVGSIIMAEQLGISIGNVLRSQSKEARQKRRQRVEEMAMKAPVKMLLPMVIFIFPAVFIVLLGPAAIQIMRAFGL
ncbi:MAG: tight adherence protein [Bacillota bacterium]|jgi:tight adherence protein C|nr:tight adherence protein [Bacillota bacterium]MDK2924761.1 tight adherence protein [Bacillota bacterium]